MTRVAKRMGTKSRTNRNSPTNVFYKFKVKVGRRAKIQ
jgi:hypothetical protein